MKIEIFARNFGSINFESDKRLIVIAGPNGVGKSRMAAELSNSNVSAIMHKRARSPGIISANNEDFKINGIYLNGDRLELSLITPDKLKEYNLDGQDNSRDERLRHEIGAALSRISNGEIAIYDDVDFYSKIKKTVSSEDVRIYGSGSYLDKKNIVEKYMLKIREIKLQNTISGFKHYHQHYASLKYSGLTKEEIIKQIGQPPWLRVQSMLTDLGIGYEFSVPDIDIRLPQDDDYQLIRKDNKLIASRSSLSSGEHALLSLFDIVSAIDLTNKAFIFDDIDGFLHVPALKLFINFLTDLSKRNKNMVVILISHSPLLVQLTKEAEYLYIENYNSKGQVITKSALIQKLTAGELIVADNFVSVFVEGNDVNFYNDFFYNAVDRGALSPMRQVKFLSPKSSKTGDGASCAAVNDIVKVLSEKGLASQFKGLIDLDYDKLDVHAETMKIFRYSKENYFFDPLNVYCWCLNNHVILDNDFPHFKGLGRGMGHAVIENLSVSELEDIIKYFSNKLLSQDSYRPNLTGFPPETSIGLNRNKSVSYPTYLIKSPGKHMMGPYSNINKRINVATMEGEFLKGNFWPDDLIDIMEKLSNLD